MSTLAQNVKNRLFLAFAAMASLISAWAFSFFLSIIRPDSIAYKIHLIFNIWLAPLALNLIREMFQMRRGVSRFLWQASLILAGGLSIALSLTQWQENPVFLQLVYFGPILVGIQLVAMLLWGQKAQLVGTSPFQEKVICLWGVLVLATSVMDHVPWMGRIIPSLGNLGLAIYVFFLSQAITRQKLLNFEALATRFFVLAVLAFLLTIFYLILVAWIENSPPLFFLNSFIASFLILMILQPLQDAVSRFTHRLLTKKHRRLEELMLQAQGDLDGVVDAGVLVERVFSVLQKALEPGCMSFFILSADGSRYRLMQAVEGTEKKKFSDWPAHLREVAPNNSLLVACKKRQEKGGLPILFDQMLETEAQQSATQLERERCLTLVKELHALKSNIMIPFFDGDKIQGLVTLGVTAPPEPWGRSWVMLPVFYPYAQKAGQTMRHFQEIARQREKDRLAALGEMAAGLAHEIRNPLGAIKGAAQYLDPSPQDPESRFLQIIVEEVDRLNRVVSQFLDYSKPDPADFERVDLFRVIQKTVEMLQPQIIPEARISIQGEEGVYFVSGSFEQFQQVILNFIQNSLQAIQGRASPEVRITLRKKEDAGSQRKVLLTIEDNGVGIAAENLSKLFIPFFTTTPRGTGLGLSISQKLIEAHGGRIEVESEVGVFSRFSVWLPHA